MQDELGGGYDGTWEGRTQCGGGKGAREGKVLKRESTCLPRCVMQENGLAVGMWATTTERGGEIGGQPRWVMERIVHGF